VSDRIFYAATEDQNVKGKINSYVPSKFLVRNGMYVVDPVPGASQKANLYSDGAGTSQTDGKMVDPGNYIVVPANYTEQSAQDAAARFAAVHRRGIPGEALGWMTREYWPGGSEELQRNPVGAFRQFIRARLYSAASDHYGYVTGAAGLPRELAESGGGLHSVFSKKILRSDVDTSGMGAFENERSQYRPRLCSRRGKSSAAVCVQQLRPRRVARQCACRHRRRQGYLSCDGGDFRHQSR
jgi:hypothetical protein